MPFFSKKSQEQNEKSQDAIIVQSVIDGNVDDFGKLVDKYESFVYRTVFFDIKNHDDAQDVSQEVFIKAYRALASFRHDSEFSTWLYRICKNAVYDYLRKNSKNSAVLLSEMTTDDSREFEIADNHEQFNPEKSYISKETAEIVNSAISELSEEHRNIIVMRDIDGFSYSEIATILSLEEGTVKSRLSRARGALKKKLLSKNLL